MSGRVVRSQGSRASQDSRAGVAVVGVEMSPALGNQGGPNRVAEALAKEMAQVLSQDVPWETYSTAKLISGADLARIQVPPEKTLETSGVLLDAPRHRGWMGSRRTVSFRVLFDVLPSPTRPCH